MKKRKKTLPKTRSVLGGTLSDPTGSQVQRHVCTSIAFTSPGSIGMQRDQPHWGVCAERAGKHQADE